MIQVHATEGQAGERLIKRFSGYIKSTGIAKKIRNDRYFASPKTKKRIREAAVIRSEYRAAAKKKQFSV